MRGGLAKANETTRRDSTQTRSTWRQQRGYQEEPIQAKAAHPQPKEKKENAAKSHIQRLYVVYPRKAIRKILSEQSPNYSGTREDAEAFLRSTYIRATREEIATARATYENCQWSEPDEQEMRYLATPPTADEIERKLKRAVNTAPGKDGIEYRHLRSLDPRGRLLEVIFGRVWALGIPASWKVSRTVPIYKKGDQSQYENFRPISLLPTMYKMFSGILAARLVDTATTHQWLSPEQKGFLPMVRGVQEHTFLLQAVIDEAKRTKKDISITWLDLTNAFGSLFPSYLNSANSDVSNDNRSHDSRSTLNQQNIVES